MARSNIRRDMSGKGWKHTKTHKVDTAGHVVNTQGSITLVAPEPAPKPKAKAAVPTPAPKADLDPDLLVRNDLDDDDDDDEIVERSDTKATRKEKSKKRK